MTYGSHSERNTDKGVFICGAMAMVFAGAAVFQGHNRDKALNTTTDTLVTCLNVQNPNGSQEQLFHHDTTYGGTSGNPTLMTVRDAQGRAIATTHINSQGHPILAINRHDENGTPIIAGTGVGAPHEEAVKQCAARISFKI